MRGHKEQLPVREARHQQSSGHPQGGRPGRGLGRVRAGEVLCRPKLCDQGWNGKPSDYVVDHLQRID